MLGGKFLKCAGMVTLFLFVFFLFSTDFALGQEEEDVLLKARRLYQQGDYEGSIKILGDFISKLRAMVEQKRNVAEAFYLLAKIYYEVGDDVKVDENLRKCFDTFPAFTMEETNPGFRDRVNKVRKEVLEAKTKPEEETFEPEEPEAEERVIEQPSPVKEKKKKKFPVLLVVGGIVVIGVVLALALGGGKKDEPRPERFDIRGDWTIIANYLGGEDVFYLAFSGSLNSGTFVDQDGDTGTYSVDGNTVYFEYDYFDIYFDGRFENRDNMRGTYQAGDYRDNWRANRGFTSPLISKTSAIKAQTGKKK